ncbi:aminopeptidase P family protein [Reichenbachiella agarivorans]|uniref:Xaa-Pro aminopeptidase n=1 Tax=Reichenbachiella agarivorans TaxID=2979464 RepID=A0ABY6CKI1_9BACT|nr:aminopeptidase P family protein [Reichenbachiella agarivorans]UXP31031.1 aminopeptidase P family protein [Reichenbachiella agarivorans]
MKYHPINKELFLKNRAKFGKRLKPNSVAVLNSSDIMPTSADGTLPFKQDANLIYLSGIDQEESILLIAPDFPNESMREILFLRRTNEEIAIWEGHKYTQEEAQEASGIKNIMWLESFESVFNTILAETEYIYLDSNEHIRNASVVETRTERFNKWCQTVYKLHKYERIAPILTDLRCIKEPEEIKQLQHACDITEKGFRRILEFTKPGVWEYELEAEFIYEFLRNRATGFGYQPIIASGANSCVLHYIENNKQCQDDDLILFDVGAEYANYNADMTRTIPVNGKFTKRQKDVYNAVLRVKNAATEMLTPGNAIPEYHKEVGKIMEGELLALGLLRKSDIEKQDPNNPAYKRYFMHGTSHHLGINVHDVASIYKKFEPGMVLTVEPGIYIREEGIGIRLEDNIVITEKGHINLMRNIPIHADEIESLMNK